MASLTPVTVANLAITGTLSAAGMASTGLLTAAGLNNTGNLATTGTSALTGLATASAGINVIGSKTLNFGSDLTKATNAGNIGYQIATSGALDVYGGGTTVGSRVVKLWDNVTVSNSLTVGGYLYLSGTIACAKVVPWTAITCQGYFTPFGSGFTAPQYCVDELGYVRLRGLGSFGNNTSLVSTGPSTLNSLAVTTTATIANLTVSSAETVNGTLAVTGASTLNSASISSTLSVSGASTLSALSTSGAAAFGSTLTATGATTLNGPATVNNTLAVTGAGGLNVTAGDISLKNATIGYDTSSVGFEKLAIKLNGTTALQLFNSDQHLDVTGGIISNSITAHAGQPLTLTGSDPAGTVIVNGRLQFNGPVDTINSTELNVNDLHIRVAHSDSGAQADSLANGAGLIVETGTSGLARSLQWNYVQGIDFKPSSASTATNDGVSTWEVKGGNLLLTRVIPSANHISYSFSTGTYAADNTQTTVSYRFAISDDERLSIEKVAGANLAAGPGANNAVQPIGSTAPVVAVFELPAN